MILTTIYFMIGILATLSIVFWVNHGKFSLQDFKDLVLLSPGWPLFLILIAVWFIMKGRK